MRQRLVSRRPATSRRLHLQGHAALLSELERVAQKILEHLMHPRGVGMDRPRQVRRQIDVEVERLVDGHLPERLVHGVGDLGERQIAQADGHHARLDLRQIEDVVDQGEQILT